MALTLYTTCALKATDRSAPEAKGAELAKEMLIRELNRQGATENQEVSQPYLREADEDIPEDVWVFVATGEVSETNG